ncbi:MAG: tlde1 domain-containing protein [Pseudomonadota bacterium]
MTSKRSSQRWVVVPAVGAALVLWSAATMAGLYSVSTSLTAASNGLPRTLLAPGSIALGDQRRQIANSWAPRLAADGGYKTASLTGGCDAGCLSLATSFAHDGKVARLKPAAPDSIARETAGLAHEQVVVVASAAGFADRFDGVVKRAALSPQKLAAAFARAENAPFMLASLPASSRFGGAQPGAPAEARFGSNRVDVHGASELALALANVLPEQTVDVPTTVALSAAADEASGERTGEQGGVQVASLTPQDGLPDSIDVPGLRPQTTLERAVAAPQRNAAAKPEPAKPEPTKPEAAKPQTAQSAKSRPGRGQPTDDAADAQQTQGSPRGTMQAALPGVPGSKPIKGGKAQAPAVLAYAKPDQPERGGLGSAFRNLFSGPSMGNGVAVYDISAKTVYMPDGSRLEAHSGLGSMVDQPRFVNRKNTGPTPPDTYNLTLRESRFHGVEAIRLTPTSGSNKYGRNGLLAHTYMLRGGRAESNGCVVFRDYKRFLAAYKNGKIKRLVVVPRLTRSLTQVAQEGRDG